MDFGFSETEGEEVGSLFTTCRKKWIFPRNGERLKVTWRVGNKYTALLQALSTPKEIHKFGKWLYFF